MFERIAFIELRGRPLDERPAQLLTEIRKEIESLGSLFEQRDGFSSVYAPPALQPTQCPGDVGQSQDRIAQCAHLARRRAPERGATRQPFQIAHAIERFAQPPAAASVVDQNLHCVEPRVDRAGIDEWSEQPAPQQSAAHGRQGAVERFEQCRAFDTRPERFDELEIAAGHLIEWQHVAAAHDRGVRQMWQATRLELSRVAQQRARGANRGTIIRTHAEPIQRGNGVGAHQVFTAELSIEFPRLSRRRRRSWCSERRLSRQDQFPGFEPCQRLLEIGDRHNLEDQFTRREIERGQADGWAARIEGDEIVVAIADEPVVGEHGAWRNRFHHGPADDAFGELGVLDLLADRDPMALGDQPAQILGGRFHGNARQRDRGGAAVVAGRQRQPQLARGELGIVLEHFVEVAHPEEQDGLGITGLDVAVLLHHRCFGDRHGSSTTKG